MIGNLCIVFIGLFFVLFFSGVFECFLVHKCTSCGKTEKNLISVCWMYEGFVDGPGLPPKIGVVHKHHLCIDCWKVVSSRLYFSGH